MLGSMRVLLSWIVLALAIGPAAHAQTPKSGAILSSETWFGEIEIVGDVTLGPGVTVTVLPGTTVTFVADRASISIPQTGADSVFRLLGTESNRIRVTTAPGVGPGRIGAFGTYYATGLQAEYTDFSNLGGTGTEYALYHSPRDAGDFFIVRRCTFTNCFTIHGYAYGSSAYIEFSGNDFREGRGAALKISGTSGPLSNHVVRDNTSDSDFQIYAYRSHVFDNVLHGVDVQLVVQVGSDESLIERNYVHNPVGDGAGAGIAMPVNQDDVVIRHNFVCGGQQSMSLKLALRGQVYENVIQAVAQQHEHVTGLPSSGLFARNVLIGEPVIACMITSSPPSTNATVKNNVVNGNGSPGLWLGHLLATAGVADVRNNVFYDCAGPALGAIYDESALPDALIGIDYNCFYSPAVGADNYDDSIVLSGRTERVDAGFGKHDLEPDGPVDQQVDPLFVRPITASSIAPADLMNRTRTIDEVLAEVRAAYALRPGSPCIDAGDPRDAGDPDVRDGVRDIGLEFRPRR
jgi:hypothetical protein